MGGGCPILPIHSQLPDRNRGQDRNRDFNREQKNGLHPHTGAVRPYRQPRPGINPGEGYVGTLSMVQKGSPTHP